MASDDQRPESVELRCLSEFYRLELLAARYTRHVFPRHWHETYVIEVVEAGVDEFYCRNAMYVARPGSIIVINPREVHSGHPIGHVPLQYRSLYPSVELLRDVAGRLSGRTSGLPCFRQPVIWDPPLAHRLIQAHKALLTSTESDAGDQVQMIECLSEFILRHASPSDTSLPRVERSAVARARDYIVENYSESISLSQLAQIAGLSPYHLLRVFRASIGLPPYEFLLSVRIERASELLLSQESIAQVAFDTGFYDQSHLTRHFKQIRGLTPGQYLKSLKFGARVSN